MALSQIPRWVAMIARLSLTAFKKALKVATSFVVRCSEIAMAMEADNTTKSLPEEHAIKTTPSLYYASGAEKYKKEK